MSEDAPASYEVTRHVCARCLGAILRAGDTYRCAGCGATGHGSPAALCACGWTLPTDSGRPPARFACIPNPARSPANPALIVAAMIATPEPSAEGVQFNRLPAATSHAET